FELVSSAALSLLRWSFMNEPQLRALFEQIREGAIDVEQAVSRVRHMPFEDLGFAKVDHHRALRHGMPEVVFGLGKTTDEILAISGALLERSPNVLITRVAQEAAGVVLEKFPAGEHFPRARAIRFWRDRTIQGRGKITVVCAGTSDIPVAQEARIT